MPEEKVITLEEFLEMKRQEARQMALANSYNATEPRLAKRYYDEADLKRLQYKIKNSEDLSIAYNNNAEELEKKLNHPIAPKHLFIFNPKYRNVYTDTGLNNIGEILLDDLAHYQSLASLYKKDAKNYQDKLNYVNKNGYDWTGANCITNATGWYGDPYVCASNIEFKKDPSKYGFVEINPNDALPGDIFQYSDGYAPHHATMYSKKGDDGTYYSNYSNGLYDSPINHDSIYWGIGQNAFRFVGLPEDIEAWTKEYNDTYKKLGGMKKVRKKKMLGAAIIGAATSLIGTGINLAQQKQLHDEQMAQQKEQMNIANANTRITNLNQLANNDMSWAYDKFNNFRCGGKKRVKADLGKFKPRFDK